MIEGISQRTFALASAATAVAFYLMGVAISSTWAWPAVLGLDTLVIEIGCCAGFITNIALLRRSEA